ncbi:MAG: hypothetical protein IPM42_06255 [Saprospiraceae bacterium]|nr:hypothetical protein [Saprospiraceae bacterium]
MSNHQNVQNAIDSGYDFRIGAYYSRGFELFKQKPLEFIGYIVLFLVISMIVSFIPLLGFIISIIITPALTVGVANYCHLMEKGENPEFGNFFDGFKKLTPLIVAYLLTLVIYLIISLPLIFIVGFSLISTFASGDPEGIFEATEQLAASGLWISLYALIILYIAVSLRWTLYLVFFQQYDAVEAIKTSWKLVNKKWFSHFLFLLLAGVLFFLGIIALLVGIFVALPVYYAADYVAFADVTGLHSSDEIDEIGMDEGIV